MISIGWRLLTVAIIAPSMEEELDKRALWIRTFKLASPWMALTILLYASQLWAILGSEFTMPVTLLQIPFIIAFLVFIVVIAHERAKVPKIRD
jgi:hypothetical protein